MSSASRSVLDSARLIGTTLATIGMSSPMHSASTHATVSSSRSIPSSVYVAMYAATGV